MNNVKELVKGIKAGLKQVSTSVKDEELVMRTMLNDKSYKVDVYSNKGKEGTFCPAEEARELAANIIHGAAKISKDEAKELADNYDFKKADSISMINISKEFVNTYIASGRKLGFGGRKDHDFYISQKEIKKHERISTYPKKVGIDKDGKGIYQKSKVKTIVPSHATAKVYASCPDWLK